MLISLKKANKENGNLDLYRLFEYSINFNKYKYLLGVGDLGHAKYAEVDRAINNNLNGKYAYLLRSLRNKTVHYFDWNKLDFKDVDSSDIWNYSLSDFSSDELLDLVDACIKILNGVIYKNDRTH